MSEDGARTNDGTDGDDARDADDRPALDAALRAGIALYNADHYHAAHAPWEAVWLPLDAGTPDERLLHGLIQFTAAVHHATERNWAGATGLAASASEYLADVPPVFRGVDLDVVRSFLARLEADPERIERRRPPRLTCDGTALRPATLDLDALALATRAMAEERDDVDEGVVDDAIRHAREERDTGRSQYASLLADIAGDDDERRAVAYARLREHVERERTRDRDVDGLF